MSSLPRIALLLAVAGCTSAPRPAEPLPRLLSQTGLDAHALEFSPQYPLWTDGAAKRRWLKLPPGTAIDASNPDRWELPAGAKLWKQFDFGGRPVETRFIERLPDGSWRFAAYVWNEAGTDAELAPAGGLTGVAATSPTTRHDVPGTEDCRACHEGRPNRVLGLGALQLAPHLDELARAGVIEGLPAELRSSPPRIAAANDDERAALGYLFGNCAHCHNADGPLASVGLDFDQPVAARGAAAERTHAVDAPSRFRFPRGEATARIARGAPELSITLLRMRSRDPLTQMPPLGTHLVDPEGVRLVSRWISQL